MKFTCVHSNLNVYDLDASVAFYKKALGLSEVRRREAEDGNFILVFLAESDSAHQIELTWLSGHDRYELGDNESHIAFRVDDIGAARKLHDEMGCVCYTNEAMGIYFIEDPDGYWIEILPTR